MRTTAAGDASAAGFKRHSAVRAGVRVWLLGCGCWGVVAGVWLLGFVGWVCGGGCVGVCAGV